MTVIAQCIMIRTLPSNRSLGATTDFTPKHDGLSCLTCYLTQWYYKLWGNWKKKINGISSTEVNKFAFLFLALSLFY